MLRARAIRRPLLVGLLVLGVIGILAIRTAPIDSGGGLTQSKAIEIAWSHVDPGASGVSSAEVRTYYQTGFDIPVHPKAWVVTFRGQWHLLCDGGCDPTTEWVAIDYYTGEWIASQYSYRAPG